MPISPDPVSDDGPPPAEADVVVIGGGIVGVSAAYWLARAGHRVALLEKGRVAGEQSGRNWGFVRQQGRDAAELPLARESLAMWDRLGNEMGGDTGFRRTGVLYVTDKPDAAARWEAYVARARPLGIESRMLSPAQVREHIPGCARDWIAGLHTPADGRAEPARAAPALAEAARRNGATIHQRSAARALLTEGGRVTGVATERGPIRAGAVVLAGGAWSSLFLRGHGVVLPQLAVRATVLRTEACESVLEGGLTTPDFSMRRRLDGGYSVAISGRWTFDLVPDAFRWFRAFLPAFLQQKRNLRLRIGPRFVRAYRDLRPRGPEASSPFEATREWDPEPDPRVLRDGIARMAATFPVLSGTRIADAWAGMIDITPDAVPVIGPVASLPGLTLATGFSGHGFALGPAAGRLAADLATAALPIVDPAPFRLERLGTARIAQEELA
jgi:glycine/D-amino acid oxidase-like deaminating enzyme